MLYRGVDDNHDAGDDWGDFGSPTPKTKAATPTKAAASITATSSPASAERKLTKFELAQKRKEERLKKKAGAQ